MATTGSISNSLSPKDRAASAAGSDENAPKKGRTAWYARYRKARLVGEIVYHEMVEDRVFTQAAALTYKTLFSLLPVFVLSLLILSKISGVGGKALDVEFKQKLYDQLNISTMKITDTNGTAVSLQETSDKIIDNARAALTSPATGMVAFGILLYGAISLMIVIETTFNQMFGAGSSRSWGRRILLYWGVLTLGPIGVGGSIVLSSLAVSVAKNNTGNALGGLLSFANIFSGYVVSWVLFTLLYKLVPQTRVNWRHAAFGAGVAAVAWEIGKWGFSLYVHTALKGSWYGSIGVLPLFMFWLYISWSIVLSGLELTYVQQYWRRMKRRYLFLRAHRAGMGGFGENVMVSDVRWVLSLAVMICRRFRQGKTTGVDEAAEGLMLPNDVAGAMLTAMERAGLVHCTAAESNQYTLARPPENVTAYDLLNSMRSVAEIPAELIGERTPETTASGAMREFEELETAWARKHTLAELAN